MRTYKVVYLDQVDPGLKELMESHVPLEMSLFYWSEMNHEEQQHILGELDFFLVATHPLPKELISGAKKLKLIQKTGIGVDNIDVETARLLGIPVSNTPGGNTAAVAELTILFILALYRKLITLNEATKNGTWLMWELRPHSYEMNGKVHGLVGFGNIGKEVAKRSKAFGTRIVYYDKFRLPDEQEREWGVTYLPLAELFAASDIVSLHIPLMPETRHLISRKLLSLMKKTSILVNVARGNIVDEQALYEVLRAGQIAGAAVDVWADEPIDPNHPLLKLENVIATPHIGAGTRDTLDRVLQIAFGNMKRVVKGEKPLFIVNK